MGALKSTTEKWPTAREIAEALEVHVTSVQRRATKENWPYQETTVRGGQLRRYNPATLPRAVRLLWRKHKKENAAHPNHQMEALLGTVEELQAFILIQKNIMRKAMRLVADCRREFSMD
ncbi:MAG: hypothetical protein A2512_08935 [Deltaproteobacteria bacterium RIFOXYD12_FULL_56_24]|nr:MAG: hypothetical protein A2512_08935 [Deltaproteobacteria bacterium RIFOXYD12_FULL_56_24]